MATGGKQRDTRAERERVRVYQARRSFQAGQIRRRTRDNLLAGVGGGLLLVGIIAGQAAYFTVGPGAPEPVPTATPTPTGTATPEPSPATPEPSPTAAIEPSPTPTP